MAPKVRSRHDFSYRLCPCYGGRSARDVLLVGGVYSVRFRFASKPKQNKVRSLLFTKLVKGPRYPAAGLATMMSAPRDGWPSSYAQFPAMEAEQARLLDDRWTELGRAGTQARNASWYAYTRSHLQDFFFAARGLERIVRSNIHADKSRHLSAFAYYKLFVLQQWNIMCTSGDVSATTSWPTLWATHFGYQLHSAPTGGAMKDQMLFLALSCSTCATVGFATQFCFVCKHGFPVKVSSEQFQQGFDAWKASTTSPDTSSEVYRTSNSYSKDTLSSAANLPTAPEAWHARLATDQTIVPSAPVCITSV